MSFSIRNIYKLTTILKLTCFGNCLKFKYLIYLSSQNFWLSVRIAESENYMISISFTLNYFKTTKIGSLKSNNWFKYISSRKIYYPLIIC